MPPDSEQQNRSPRHDVDVLPLIEESRRLIDFLNGELKVSLRAADRECVSVGRSLQELSRAKACVESLVRTDPKLAIIGTHCRSMDESITAIVVGLQYHDRLAQRIEHVRTALERLQSVLNESKSGMSCGSLRNMKHIELAYAVERARLADAAASCTSNANPGAAAIESNVELF